MTNVIDRQNEEPAGSNRKIVRLLAWEGSPEADRRIRDDPSEQAGTSANRSRERPAWPNQISCSELALRAAYRTRGLALRDRPRAGRIQALLRPYAQRTVRFSQRIGGGAPSRAE